MPTLREHARGASRLFPRKHARVAVLREHGTRTSLCDKARACRLLIAVLCLLAFATGCAVTKPKSSYQLPPLTQEQADWWQANKHRKRYVPGRGYQVEGVSGFFDHNGRKLPDELVNGGDRVAEDQGLLERLAPKNGVKQFKKLVGKGPNEAVARAAMNEGDTLFRQKQFDDAAKKYAIAHDRWPDSTLEEEAMFKAGESLFFADRYSKAEDKFAELTKKYPSTQYLSQVVTRRFAIGRYWEQYDVAHPHWPLTPNVVDKTRPMFDTAGHALKVYERIRLEDPTGPLADDSLMATASAHFVNGRWDDADYHYGLLRSEYPQSEFQYQAHLLGLRCKLLKYQGADYDGSPLDEAEELATQLLTQFSQELGNERERVVQVRASIVAQRAQREWNMAEYYAKGEYYLASRHFYEKIVDEYPDTQLAQQSRARLEQIKSEPDNPSDPFAWLVGLLPESKREGPVLPKVTPAVASGGQSTVQR
jgi:outer membrane protein assembly factor BamD (BamD/ComL family)